MYEMNQILKQLRMSIKEFSEHYEIPYNTVRQWAQGTRKPPNYVIKLLNEKIERETKGEQLKIGQKVYYVLKTTTPTNYKNYRFFENYQEFEKELRFEKNIQKLTRKSIEILQLVEGSMWNDN